MSAVVKFEPSNTLVRYNAARYALQEAVAVDEVKGIRDKALAMAAYAKQAGDTALIEMATEIRVRAERKAGEMLAAMPKSTGAMGSGSNQHEVRSPLGTAPTLSELGITKNQSARWQKLAAVPQDQFEQAVAAAKEVAGEVTARAIVEHRERAAKPAAVPKTTPDEDAQLRAEFKELAEIADDLRRENETLRAQVAAFESTAPDGDLRRQIATLTARVNHAEHEQGITMDRAAKTQDREKWIVKLLRQCAKAVGIKDPAHTDPRDIVKAVQAYAEARA